MVSRGSLSLISLYTVILCLGIFIGIYVYVCASQRRKLPVYALRLLCSCLDRSTLQATKDIFLAIYLKCTHPGRIYSWLHLGNAQAPQPFPALCLIAADVCLAQPGVAEPYSPRLLYSLPRCDQFSITWCKAQIGAHPPFYLFLSFSFGLFWRLHSSGGSKPCSIFGLI